MKHKIKTILFVLMLFIFTSHFHASFDIPAIDLSLDNKNIGKNMLYLEDKEASLKFQDIRNLPAHDFKTVEREIDSRLFTTSALWYRFDAYNKDDNAVKKLITFGIAWLDEVSVYIQDPNGKISLYRGGDTLPYKNRSLESVFVNFEHSFGSGRSKVYLHVKTADPFIVPVSVVDTAEFLRGEASRSNTLGFIYGIIVAMILYNMMLFLNIRANHYAFYVLYLSMFLLMNASYGCYTFKWIFYDDPAMQNWAESTTIFLFSIAGLLFAKSFLNLKALFARLNRATDYLILSYIAIMAITFLAGYHYHVMSSIILSVVFSLYAFGIALYSLLRGNLYARFFLLGTTAGLLGTSATALTVMSVIPYSDIGFHAIEYGMAIDAVLLSFALADKMKSVEAQKTAAQKEAKEALEAKKAKEEFLSNMSHEIRTPMNAIIGFIHILKNKITDKEHLSYIDIVHSNSQTLLHLIDNILDLSKIESSKVAIEKHPFDPYEELGSIERLFEAVSIERSVPLSFKINPNVPYCLEGDLLRIKQILLNFLNNAFKFTPEGKRIFVEADYLQKSLCVSVRDEGIGISKEARTRIFNAFEQADSSTTKKYGGTGLGLSISLKLAKLMDGEITLESQEGRGSTFTLCVPLATCKNAVDALAGQERLEINSISGHVLVAEDNSVNQFLMKALLEEYGLEHTIVSDGAEALDIFKKSKFDLVLMDDSMPNMSGTESLKKMREHENRLGLKRTPIIAISANVMQEDKERFFEAGADDFVSKPIDISELEKVLGRFLCNDAAEKKEP